MQLILVLAYIAVGIAQVSAGMEGMHLYFGVGTIVSLILFLLSFCIPIVGSLCAALAVYYGARYGWRWEWWQALLLAAPGLVLSLAVVGAGGLAAAFQRR